MPGLPNQSFSYDANDQLTSDTYDANGNTLTSPGSGVTVPDTYDHANRLIARQTPSGAATFQYDGEGNRVGKTVGGVTTHFVVDELNPTGWPQVLEEQGWQAANPALPPAVTRVYTYGHTPLSQEQLVGNAWTTSHFGQDAHGNVRYLSDPSGRVTDTYDYDAFGSTIARSGATPATRLFTGEEYDADLGLYHLRARYQNPASGRFWTRDRFEGYKSIPNSQHGYGYVGNNPVTWIDPSGHESMGEVMAVTTMVPMVRGMMDHLWSSINSYNYGLGGGSITAPDRQDQLPVNTAEAMFMQGLSQHRGVNLGRDNFFAAMQGAPFLLAANPFVIMPPPGTYLYNIYGFQPDAPIHGCPNRHDIFTLDRNGRVFDQALESVWFNTRVGWGTAMGMVNDFDMMLVMLNPGDPRYQQMMANMQLLMLMDYLNGGSGWGGTRNVINRFNPVRAPFEAISGLNNMEGPQFGQSLTWDEKAVAWANTVGLVSGLAAGGPGTISQVSADLRSLKSLLAVTRNGLGTAARTVTTRAAGNFENWGGEFLNDSLRMTEQPLAAESGPVVIGETMARVETLDGNQ